jgi:hypothetical protein
MFDENDHGACVNAWMDRVARGLPPERLIQAFERGFSVLWSRAYRTLGDVTLTAIVDRVLYQASEEYPILRALKIEAKGLRWELHEDAGRMHPDQLSEGLRFVMVEFLTVLGNLTAEILTKPLHAELASVGSDGEKVTS